MSAINFIGNRSLRAFSKLYLWLAVITLGCGEEWSGWRGLEKQGVGKAPLECNSWSTNDSVLWEVPVPGKGHSSPIVQGDHVYLTTAVETSSRSSKRFVQVLVLGGAAIMALGGFVGFGVVRVKGFASKDQPPLKRTLPWFLILGCVVGLIYMGCRIVGVAVQGHQVGLIKWLASINILAACLVAAVYGSVWRCSWRVGWVLALMGLSGVVFLGRPNPEYYNPIDGARNMLIALRFGIVWPAMLGVLLPFALLVRRLRPGETTVSACGGAATRFKGWQVCLLSLLAFGVGLTIPLAIFLTPALANPLTDLLQGGQGGAMRFLAAAYATLLFIAVFWIFADLLHSAPRAVPMPIWLRMAVPLLGLVSVAQFNRTETPQLDRAVISINRHTGALEWIARALDGPANPLHKSNTDASPTPVVDDTAVYAYFGAAGAMAVAPDGSIRWVQRELPMEAVHGAGASPVLVDRKLIVLSDAPAAPYITALDVRDGSRSWLTPRISWKGGHECHCTPVVAELDGRSLIIVWSWRELTVYDAVDGSEVAKFTIPGELRGVRVATPIVDGDRLYVFNLNQVCAIDIRALLASKPPMLWTTGMKHRGPDTATAVLHAGYLFMVSDAGDVSCLDARDGRLVWQRRLPARSASYYASPVVVGDDLLISDTRGVTHVLSADARGEAKATNDLGSPIYASAAPVDGRLYIRTTGSLWCIGTRRAKSHDIR